MPGDYESVGRPFESGGAHHFCDAELRAITEAVPGTELEALVPLILFTATRSEEARSARWADMDLERRVWTVPDVKQGGTHVLPLSTGAMKVLTGARRSESPYVFPAHTKEGYVDHPQKAVLRARELSGVSDFRLHTLRTTVRTRLSELGVAPDVGERILGHTMGRSGRSTTNTTTSRRCGRPWRRGVAP